MTTIATNGKAMAADGRLTKGSMILKEDCDKIIKVFVEQAGESLLIGVAGCVAHMDAMIEHIKDTYQGEGVFLGTPFGVDDIEEEGPHPSETEGLILTEGGKVFVCAWAEPVIEAHKYQAIGSGADFAIGAMHAGKGPAEAVLIASRVDTNTNGIVTEKRLENAGGKQLG